MLLRCVVLTLTLALGQSVQGAPAKGPDPKERVAQLLNQSMQESDAGRYGDARSHAQEAAAIAEKLGDLRSLGIARNRLGLVSYYEGSYADAEQDFRAAATLSTQAGDHEGRAEVLGNLGNVQFMLGKYADASSLYAEALKTTTEASTAPWAERRRRLIRANQATLYQRLGRDRDALAIYQSLDTEGTLPPREQAQFLTNLGVLYRRLGDPIKALEMYDQARALLAADRDVYGELRALTNRGIVLASDLGRLHEAEVAFSDALAKAASAGNRPQMLLAQLYRGETRLRAGDSARAHADFDTALATARQLKAPEEEWKALFGLGRSTPGPAGVTLLNDAVGVIEHVRENIRVPLLRTEFLNDKRDVYDALIAARLESARAAEIFDLLERSKSRGWRERLGLSGTAGMDAIQGALPPGGVLLDYWWSARGSAVVAVSKDRAAVFRVAVNPASINRLLEALGSPGDRWRASSAELASLLPPHEWIDGATHLLVVPDGAIALVPFDVLPVNGRLLLEQVAVTYTPTAATLQLSSQAATDLRLPWTLQLRAFADPVFGAAALDDKSETPARLRAADAEVRRVSSELSGRSIVHTGADDLKTYLMNGSSGAPILHLATHALADTTAIERSRIFFSPAHGGDADYLFLREAYDLPLKGVELAVLSACDTERGPILRAEGVQSFSRAFLAAGARSTVTTLWRVADGPTADFMAVFYHHLQRGLTRDEALRQAKLRFLQSGTALADPHYWSAFVLTGIGPLPVPRAVSWTLLGGIGGGAALLVGGGVALWWRRRAADYRLMNVPSRSSLNAR